jgi:hypothetical protein
VLGPDALDEDDQWATDLVPAGPKSAGGTGEILRPRSASGSSACQARLDKGVPFSELRAKEKEAAAA